MVLADFFTRRFLEPQREKYREHVRKETATRWREWNQRRLDAQARGEDFNEPPPVDE